MKSHPQEFRTLNGTLVINADGDLVHFTVSEVKQRLSWLQIITLRNKLTKLIDNKRASDKYKHG